MIRPNTQLPCITLQSKAMGIYTADCKPEPSGYKESLKPWSQLPSLLTLPLTTSPKTVSSTEKGDEKITKDDRRGTEVSDGKQPTAGRGWRCGCRDVGDTHNTMSIHIRPINSTSPEEDDKRNLLWRGHGLGPIATYRWGTNSQKKVHSPVQNSLVQPSGNFKVAAWCSKERQKTSPQERGFDWWRWEFPTTGS